MELLGHMVKLCLIVPGTARLFSNVDAWFSFPPAVYDGSEFSILPQHLLLYVIFIQAILEDVK